MTADAADLIDGLHLDHPCRYDRHWFGGQSADGGVWFSAALGRYPNVVAGGLMDGGFMVAAPERQTGFIGSRPLAAEGSSQVPGFALETLEPHSRFRLVARNRRGDFAADLEFTAWAPPVAEPRYTFSLAGHTVMDLRRCTQGGRWSGWIRAHGQEWTIEHGPGTRDRSWGQRPLGRRPPAPPGTPPFPWFWIWMPLEFPGYTLLFHTNDHPDGTPWNRHAVLVPHAGEPRPLQHPQFTVRYHPGTRWLAAVTLQAQLPEGPLTAQVATRFAACTRLVGYNHPTHGHGTVHAVPDAPSTAAAVLHEETLDPDHFHPGRDHDVHVQSPCVAHLTLPGATVLAGRGMVEQMILGPHAPSGFRSFTDLAGD